MTLEWRLGIDLSVGRLSTKWCREEPLDTCRQIAQGQMAQIGVDWQRYLCHLSIFHDPSAYYSLLGYIDAKTKLKQCFNPFCRSPIIEVGFAQP
ncbi:jg26354 [Pararge aegeria aegeria]|uniref:Jg26354 protein n=1 Tax=Pararge aegeria aegeria TaxID=348720 RepID=A0A8S4QML8_9NEOP|nr:jg26354 [Pararge aegeria aegeria]